MKKSQWKEEEIETLLSQLPKVKDHRDPKDIYANAQKSRRFKKKTNWKPIITSAAALFIIAIISPFFFFHESSQQETAQDKASDEKVVQKTADFQKEKSENSSEENSTQNSSGQSKDNSSATVEYKASKSNDISLTSLGNSTLVFPADIENKDFLTIAIPTKDAQYIVPLTILLQEATPEQTLGKLVEYSDSIDESKYGLENYYPLVPSVQLEESKDAIKVKFEKDASFNHSENIFIETLKETFRYQGIKQLQFSTDDSNGVELGEYGFVDTLEIEPFLNRATYIYKTDKSTPPLFVPSEVSFEHFEDAIDAMRTGTDFEGINPAIPEEMKITNVEKNGKHLTVSIAEESNVQDNEKAVLAIEAMLLTARDFGFTSVNFQSNNIQQVGSYKMNSDLDVPVSPNIINVLE